MRLPSLQIRDIRISGIDLMRSEVSDALRATLGGRYFFLLPKSSFFMVSTQKLSQEIQKDFPQIESVAVIKKISGVLEVSGNMRILWGVVCNDFSGEEATSTPESLKKINCVYVDKTGFAYENAPDMIGSLIMKVSTDYEVKPAVKIFDEKEMQLMLFLQTKIKDITGFEVNGYEISKKTSRELRVKTNGEFRLWMNREDDFNNVFRVLKTVLDEEIKDNVSKLDYIDLRFGNKVFYKFK